MALELAGRRMIVTGSNTGIGRATARTFAAAGADVILACRSEQKGTEAARELAAETGNPNVRFHRLDLADLHQVSDSAGALVADGRPIQVLVNNAGIAGMRGATADGFELAFGVNHLGHFLLTTTLVPALEAAGGARVVNVSSLNHYNPRRLDLTGVQAPTKTFAGLKEYDRSKLCNVLFTHELARRFDPKVLGAFAVDPGTIDSDIWERRMPSPVAAALKRLRPMGTVQEGCRSSVRAATDPALADRSGAFIDADAEVAASNPAATSEAAAVLWDASEAWVAPFRTSR